MATAKYFSCYLKLYPLDSEIFFRLEFGTTAQAPTTPQSGAEKPLTPNGDRRE